MRSENESSGRGGRGGRGRPGGVRGRGGGRGRGRGRGNDERTPTADQLDNDLDSYFMKDSKAGGNKLDSDLDSYFKDAKDQKSKADAKEPAAADGEPSGTKEDAPAAETVAAKLDAIAA